MDQQQQKQTIFDPAKVVAVGIAAPLASLLTSRFGIAGTLVGLALSSVILTILADALKVYLARASTKVVTVPSGLRTTEFSRKGIRAKLRASLSKVVSLPPRSLSPRRRRSIMRGSFIAAGISFLVGLIIVTGVEASVGKSLSCWMWKDCPTEESSLDGDTASSTGGTLPSILGGGPSTSSSNAPQVEPVNPQQAPTPLPGAPTSPSMPPSVYPSVPPSETPAMPASNSDVANQGEENQSSPQEEQDQQKSPPDSSSQEDQQQQSPSDSSSQDQQQTPPNNTREGSSGNDQGQSSPASGRKPTWHESLKIP